MDVKEGGRHAPGKGAADTTEETRLMLALLRERLKGARDAGHPALKLEPRDVERLCAQAGVGTHATGAFRALVRQNLVRLRGRWRENRSATRAPVYVERITERGIQALVGSE